MTFRTALEAARHEQGWSKTKVIHLLRAAARAEKYELDASDSSLSRMLAQWESGRRRITDPARQQLFCRVYGQTREELGFAQEPLAQIAVPGLTERLGFSLSTVDTELVSLLEGQTQQFRLLDRKLGASRLLEQTLAHTSQMEELLQFSLPGTHRTSLGAALAEGAALAGWQALDMRDARQAWKLHEIAKAAARESEDETIAAHVTAQQGYVLLDSGKPDDARNLVALARKNEQAIPPRMRAWLCAAEAEMSASAGDSCGARTALDEAARLLPAGTEDPDLPFLALNEHHLARWRGHCLAKLGEAEAIEDLTAALDGIGEGKFARAEAGLRVDLALALTARGDAKEAQKHAGRADELAGQTGSARQRARIDSLLRGTQPNAR